MHRRAFIVSALTAASTITAGCGSPTEDDSPSESDFSPEGDLPSDSNTSLEDDSSSEGDSFRWRTEHTNPTVQTDDNSQDTAKYLEFNGDSVDLPTVGINPGGDPLPNNFFTTISHSENTELQSLTQRFAVADGDRPSLRLSGQVSFTGKPNPRPSVSLSDDGQAAIVEVHGFGELADETVFMSLPVSQWPASARKLVIRNTVELVKTGSVDQIHILKGQLEFEFTAETIE
jgi:hypothetical protein